MQNNEMSIKDWIHQMALIKHQCLHTKYDSWMKIVQSIEQICVGNHDTNRTRDDCLDKRYWLYSIMSVKRQVVSTFGIEMGNN